MGDESDDTAAQITLSGDSLSAACMDLSEVPADLGDRFGSADVSSLDLSFNQLSEISRLDAFPALRTLVADNNRLTSSQPGLPRSLRVLSVNNNAIADLDAFLDSLAPLSGLVQLSMLKNPACPSPYFGEAEADEYARFRLYVVFRLPSLQFLDATPVSAKERAEAQRRGKFLRIARPDPVQYSQPPPRDPDDDDGGDSSSGATEDSAATELPPQMAEPGAAGPARFGRCSYVYTGKLSEGNRFILNQDL